MSADFPKLRLAGVRKDYADGAVVAVDGIDLDVARGETVALLGPSGCGKSTALNMIVGLERPSAGDILIDGRSVVDVPPGARDVGLVFQDYAVFTHMSVAKNLAFGLAVRGLPRAEIARRVDETAELLGLEGLLREKASALGGSQLQRVAIGRTLVTRPGILLLDEPLSNLEAEARLAMRRELRRLAAEIALTIVYVTHDQVEALSLADRIAVMSAGKIRQVDRTDVVYDRPAHTFVARFLGSPPMNLIDGRLAREDGGIVFRGGDMVLRIPDCAIGAGPAGDDVILGIRPEAIRRAAASDAMFAGRVARVSPRGADAAITVALAETVVEVLVPARDLPQEGDPIGLAFDPAAIVLFCPETGRGLAPTAPERRMAA